MKLKSKRFIVPIAVCVTLLTFMTGFIVSSSLELTPTIKALGKGFAGSSENNSLKDSCASHFQARRNRYG